MNLLNKVMMIGNLVADPVMRQTQNGTAVADVCLAMNNGSSGGGRNGDTPEEVVFVDVVLWDRLAENASRFLTKGSSVLIEGRLHQDRWQDKATGQPRRKLRVIGERMRFMGQPRRAGATAEGEPDGVGDAELETDGARDAGRGNQGERSPVSRTAAGGGTATRSAPARSRREVVGRD